MNINGNTKILGVLGYPVKHTLSPAIHNFLIDKYKLNLIYLPIEVKNTNINNFIKGISQIENLDGFNITVPYKVYIMQYLNRISGEAHTIGAVNTVKIKNNKLSGFNTDIFGFKKSIEINFPEFQFKGKRVLLLGAGGSGFAIAYSLLKNNIKELIILNRTYQNGIKLRGFLKKHFPKVKITVNVLDFEYLSKFNYFPDLIINTTSYGLKKESKPLINLKSLYKEKSIVYDIIYNPSKTVLLQSACQYKLPVMNGLDMLILQALKSFSIWTGIELKELIKNIKILRQKLHYIS